MAFNPCPCMSVGKGVKVLALVDAILAALFVVGLTVLLALVALHPPHQHDIKVITIVTFTFYLVFNLSEIALAMILLSAAKNQNTKKCNIWLVATCIMVGLTMLGLLSQIVQLRAVITFVTLAFSLVINLFEIGLAMLLLGGANKWSTRKCNIWLIITGTFIGLAILSTFMLIFQRRAGSESIVLIVWIPFKIYECVVVSSFVQFMKNGDKVNGYVYPNSDTRLLEPGRSPHSPHPPPQ
ncbi:hypothetical protein Ocin01_16745 [Orchesella cincta]|uniref:Uncharacterized protein n=1 Tax=Orchesella cincta TaxID=48709 RepID=A0A1D2MAD5_ORCCI|nr:hypothetical protein Ocin01_16745 [Orchesella cincta]